MKVVERRAGVHARCKPFIRSLQVVDLGCISPLIEPADMIAGNFKRTKATGLLKSKGPPGSRVTVCF